jgi:hypothetical protein
LDCSTTYLDLKVEGGWSVDNKWEQPCGGTTYVRGDDYIAIAAWPEADSAVGFLKLYGLTEPTKPGTPVPAGVMVRKNNSGAELWEAGWDGSAVAADCTATIKEHRRLNDGVSWELEATVECMSPLFDSWGGAQETYLKRFGIRTWYGRRIGIIGV